MTIFFPGMSPAALVPSQRMTTSTKSQRRKPPRRQPPLVKSAQSAGNMTPRAVRRRGKRGGRKGRRRAPAAPRQILQTRTRALTSVGRKSKVSQGFPLIL
jgi:hypothetical protein